MEGTDEDFQVTNLTDRVEWIGNQAFDDADMLNTDLVNLQVQNSTERLYKHNEAHGRSIVIQGRADAEQIAAIIQARRG